MLSMRFARTESATRYGASTIVFREMRQSSSSLEMPLIRHVVDSQLTTMQNLVFTTYCVDYDNNFPSSNHRLSSNHCPNHHRHKSDQPWT